MFSKSTRLTRNRGSSLSCWLLQGHWYLLHDLRLRSCMSTPRSLLSTYQSKHCFSSTLNETVVVILYTQNPLYSKILWKMENVNFYLFLSIQYEFRELYLIGKRKGLLSKTFLTSVSWNGTHSKWSFLVGVRVACVKRLVSVPHGYFHIVDRWEIYIDVVEYSEGVFAICYQQSLEG